MNYITLSEHYRRRFGCKVYKLSLQSGCSCPNRDGNIGFGGCIFCSEGGSGDFAAPLLPIEEQIQIAKHRVEHKLPKDKSGRYIAYFQSYTNTYGDVKRLSVLYRKTLSFPEIVGISIGTRPDCLPEEMLDMLSELNTIKPVTVELGLQTVHNKTAEKIHRGYNTDVFEKAYKSLTLRGIEVVVHVILGLPGENIADMLDTIDYLAELKPVLPGIKLQLLHILKGTALAAEYSKNYFPIFTMDEYTDLVVECIRRLPEETVIHRMTGDGPKSLLIAPEWSGDKKRVLNMLNRKLREAER
ncbi:MAG: TIGR01212 family radical SAM protein [Lachnospiraceae bacterium]|nr:TIGR01212 family radical SAM protein [Lachnospiraceae bacterium]